jgi:hypothetical protein
MRRIPLVRITLLLLAVVAGAVACDSAQSQEVMISPQLANHLHSIHVGIRAGRIQASADHNGRTVEASTNAEDRHEKLTIDVTATPSLDYDLSTAGFRVIIDLDRGNELRIRRTPVGTGKLVPLEFHQPAEGKINVIVGQESARKQYVVDSMWHLLVIDPELVKADIEPLLRLLRPGWPLASSGLELEAALYRQVDVERRYDRQAWAALVEQLSGAKYVDRVEADQRLRELGSVVVPYLRNLAEKRLDAEQAYRIRMIVRSYGDQSDDDSIESAAQWLAADPEIWYALAKRAAEPQRSRVRTQLAQILGTPLELDPTASDEVWQTQLKKVREEIDRVQPAATR